MLNRKRLTKQPSDIIKETLMCLSDNYLEYLCTKYFKTEAALVDLYTQKVYIRLFAFANNYNVSKNAIRVQKIKKEE